MKFAHLADCHLGGWRQPELQELNFKSFQKAIEKCIKEKVEFVLIAGDLFDSAYPPIETLKETFNEFRKLKEEKIPVFLIAGSHDFSVSGKTFLDVLEKAGFCINVSKFEERNNFLYLQPTIYKNFALYGYSGKKSSLEIEDIEKIKLNDSPGMFKILLLHTSIKDALKGLPIDSVDEKKLPKVDYVALGHLHINYEKNNLVYPGPIFPNNLPELTDLNHGSFCIIENGVMRRESLKIKDVLSVDFEIKNTINATQEIIDKLDSQNIKDKIIILKISGFLENGKTSDMDFQKITNLLKEKGAFCVLKSTTKLLFSEPEMVISSSNSLQVEKEIIKRFEEKNPSKFNMIIPELLNSLQLEKQDDEKSAIFEERLLNETKKVLQI